MATELHNLSDYDSNEIPNARGLKIAIIVSEWNQEITYSLRDGAIRTLKAHGVLQEDITIKTVPGSFELIYAAKEMALSEEYFDAIIILGCVIKGETPHFDYICQGVTYGIARLNTMELYPPIIYGLLTTNNLEQARQRCGGKYGNKGDECAIDAIKMANF